MKAPKVKAKNLTLSKNNISRFGRTEEDENEPEETKIAENNEDEEEDFAGTKIEESRIQKIIKDHNRGRVPEGVLTAEMQQSLETLPEIDVEQSAPSQPSLMEAPAPQEEQPQSLMAPPTGV